MQRWNKYSFGSQDNASSNKIDPYTKELVELNNLGYCYQYGLGKKKDKFKTFEFYLKSAEGGNAGAKNNLVIVIKTELE